MKRAALTLALLIATTSPAFAKTARELFAERAAALRGESVPVEEALPAVEALPSPASDSLWKLGAVAAALSAIGGVLVVIARRRLGPGERSATRIRIAASRALGPRHHLALVEVAGRRLLIGTAPNGIATLAELTENADFAAELAAELPELREPTSTTGEVAHV